MENIKKEVYFGDYCKNCEHINKKEDEDPCHDCLEFPYNNYSHKPVHFKKNK